MRGRAGRDTGRFAFCSPLGAAHQGERAQRPDTTLAAVQPATRRLTVWADTVAQHQEVSGEHASAVAVLFLAALACMPLAAAHSVRRRPPTASRPLSRRLRAAAPEGFAIYQKIKDKKFFLSWISCDEAQLGLPTAVHESVHYITAETDAFPLVHGGQVKRPHEVSAFFAPSLIAGKFKSSDFVDNLPAAGTCQLIWRFPLSARRAQCLHARSQYRGQFEPFAQAPFKNGDEVDHRDGLAALMAFVALYVERAEDSEPATWSGLQQPRVAKTVSELWGGAEKVMASSVRHSGFGTRRQSRSIRQFCQSRPQAALRKILGRAPVCPTACLKPVPVAARESQPPVDTMPTGSVRPNPAANALRPFWSRTISRRPARSDERETDD